MALGGKHAGPHTAHRRPVGKMSHDRFAVLENMAVAIDDFQRFHKILLSQCRFASPRLVKTDTLIPVSTEALRDASTKRISQGWLRRPLSVAAPIAFYPWIQAAIKRYPINKLSIHTSA